MKKRTKECKCANNVFFCYRCLPYGVITSVYLPRLMSTAEGHNSSVPAGDSETVAVVSLCLLSAHPGP